MKVGKGVKFLGFSTFSEKVEIGAYTYICGNSHLSNVTIGKYCCMAKRVSIVNSQHPYESFSCYNFFDQIGSPLKNRDRISSNNDSIPYRHTEIGNDVWIGENVCIKGGVTIGNGAVIGTASMVTKDIPPYAIAVGNPAKVIKYRFEEKKIELMERTQWWNWDPEKIYRNFNDLCSFNEMALNKLCTGKNVQDEKTHEYIKM